MGKGFWFLSVPRVILDVLEHFWKLAFDLEKFEFLGTKIVKKFALGAVFVKMSLKGCFGTKFVMNGFNIGFYDMCESLGL